MTITKNDPQSEFWKAAEAASRRVDKFPPWKLGILEPKAPPTKDELSPVVAEQAEASTQGTNRAK